MHVVARLSARRGPRTRFLASRVARRCRCASSISTFSKSLFVISRVRNRPKELVFFHWDQRQGQQLTVNFTLESEQVLLCLI